MIVIIAATGDALHILSAQLTLATAALAAVLHAGLRILFPGALQPLGAIKPTAGVLGVHLRLGIDTHLRWLHGVPMTMILTTVDFLRVSAAWLALLATAALAVGLKARLHVLLPSALTELSPGQTLTWILRCLCLAHLQVCGHGILPTQLTLLTTTALANAVHARRHTCRNCRLVLPAQLALLTPHPRSHGTCFRCNRSRCGTDHQQQAEESAGHGSRQLPRWERKFLSQKWIKMRAACATTIHLPEMPGISCVIRFGVPFVPTPLNAVMQCTQKKCKTYLVWNPQNLGTCLYILYLKGSVGQKKYFKT